MKSPYLDVLIILYYINLYLLTLIDCNCRTTNVTLRTSLPSDCRTDGVYRRLPTPATDKTRTAEAVTGAWLTMLFN